MFKKYGYLLIAGLTFISVVFVIANVNIKDYRDKKAIIEQLEEENENLRDQLEIVEEENREVYKSFEDIKVENRELKKENDKLKKENEELKNWKEERQKYINYLHNQLYK